MKTKLVLWGANAQDERLLVGVELLMDENKVKVYTFPESIITEDIYQKMMNEWRDNKEMELPEGHTVVERDLSIAEGILPEDVKVERSDVILRAQTEWNFLVLSSKLHAAYESELNDLKEKIGGLQDFDRQMWDSLRGFWSKVQEQVKERNLFRHHFGNLRDTTNALFDKMKALRSKIEDEFKETSKVELDKFTQVLSDIEEKAVKGIRLQPLFEELKNLQRKYHDTKFTRDHRNKVWKRLDSCFKLIKEKRFGDSNDSGQSHLQRLDKRYKGLVAAIDRMEQTIGRDRGDLNFQTKRVRDTDGQLEAQIREAKIKMIEERVHSKEEKLADMYKTKEVLEQRMATEKVKEEKRKQAEEAKKAAKAKIADQIKEKAEEMASDADKLQKAADAIQKGKAKKIKTQKEEPKVEKSDEKESLLDAVGATLGEAFEDVVDTIKAVAEVVGGKIEEAVEDLKEEFKEEKTEEKETTEEAEAPKKAKKAAKKTTAKPKKAAKKAKPKKDSEKK